MEKNKTYIVKNRSTGKVIYSIKEDNIRREFHAGEEKKVPFSELEKLSFQPGGRELIQRYLQIRDTEVTENLNINTEPEYYLSEEQIKDLLTTGSMDAFLDCLDFAPVGVIDIIKQLAVSLPLNDIAKRKALKNKTGFDVDKAIAHIEEEKSDEEQPAVSTGRRVQPTVQEETTRRAIPSYKVVDKQ